MTDEDNKTKKIIKYTTLKSQKDVNEQLRGQYGDPEYLGEIFVDFAGSMNEKPGANYSIDSDDAVTAKVTVYGPNGEDDIQEYDGFSMSSDFEVFGAIADGMYKVSYGDAMNSVYRSHYAVNGGGAVVCVNNINPNPVDAFSKTQKAGIYVHRTNFDGSINYNLNKQPPSIVSSGCLLISAKQWPRFENQIGKNGFTLYLHRSK